jgi:dCMP deaminase
VISYKNVLLFFILNRYGGDRQKINELFSQFYKETREEDNKEIVFNVLKDILPIDAAFTHLINDIKTFHDFKDRMTDAELIRLHDIFFGDEYKSLSESIFDVLEKHSFTRSRLLLHWVSCNIRSNGDPISEEFNNIDSIYIIAELINKLIKAKGRFNEKDKQPTKIVIDSLRNSLEIMFFKERFSAFYMVAMKDVLGNAEKRLGERLMPKIPDDRERLETIKQLVDLDEIEYDTCDFAKGLFYAPDLENCIQKSDYHIFNLKKEQLSDFLGKDTDGFFSREEQLMKLVALIQHPGLITPSSPERAMQIANTAKLNSGCISRKVGAVITDENYYVKAIGWNDVAKGHTPCNLRSVTDYIDTPISLNDQHYSKFERGEPSQDAAYKYKNSSPGNFKDAIIDYYSEAYSNKSLDLNGKNCAFCFKTVHNHYEGEANQVHTRSLHAEENAMMQITKLGGTGAKNGFLFTTASPCELCSKKAYQLGIAKIYYIDPYPGIAVDQILKGGLSQPKLMPFSGAIGTAYHKLYEGFMSDKDENSMILELSQKKKLAKEFKNLLSKTENEIIKTFAKEGQFDDKKVEEIILAGIEAQKK